MKAQISKAKFHTHLLELERPGRGGCGFVVDVVPKAYNNYLPYLLGS